ncbi:Oidioi.mRNA.OKI2018_I69.chr1.g351.t1.cds [Oikopleura dioica]|uniref:Oidioi.mRNA.OKI2018_I69.chr1.g351.t1.cds n=1 Tax=Oikopleura dioica TaxID=34765 RepID=A0ABN7SNE8_OIKDI|nr:Oidioi.mRNA.OKI2018_I69.chr1.g351.t1.cds [Oikopleura dioica]
MSQFIEGIECRDRKFRQTQCLDGECFCVDEVTGDELLPIRRIPDDGRRYLECSRNLPCLDFWYGSSKNDVVFECDAGGSYTSTLIDLQTGRIWAIFGEEKEAEEEEEGVDSRVGFAEYEEEEEEEVEIVEVEDDGGVTQEWDAYWDFYWA